MIIFQLATQKLKLTTQSFKAQHLISRLFVNEVIIDFLFSSTILLCLFLNRNIYDLSLYPNSTCNIFVHFTF